MSLQSDASGLIKEKLPLVWKIIDLFDDWTHRLATLGSLVLTSVIIVSANTRRQFRSPVWMSILWAAYKYKPKLAEYAITHLALKSTLASPVTAQEQQLVSFWAPFLLIHLAGPDNIAAFTLEDGKLSLREVLEAIWKIVQGLYVTYKYIYLCNSGVMRPAAYIMLVLGVLRYSEKAFAQLRGNFDNLWASKKKHEPVASTGVGGGECGNEGRLTALLLKAHTQFQACGHRAMSDSSVDPDSRNFDIGQEILSPRLLSTDELWEVVGMEASLMYDILYTKATLVYTWRGYLLRLASPACTAAALSLFILSPKDCEESPDIVVTYILLVTTLFLDVVWLLSALASTWTHAYLKVRASMWLGWWHKLRHIVLSLEMWCWGLLPVKVKDPTSRRMWSGRVGRYKLLAECTRCPSTMDCLRTCLASKLSMDEIWNEFQHWRCISELEGGEKKLLFDRVQQRLHGSDRCSMKAVTGHWGQKAVIRRRTRRRQITDNLKSIINKLETCFGREFQEDILLWHIGTAIFLADSHSIKFIDFIKNHEDDKNKWMTTVLAIEALSEYLMFLLAVRPRMLPGLELRKLFEVTRKALKDSWAHRGKQQVQTKWVHCYASRKEKHLAQVLRNEMSEYKQQSDIAKADRRLIWAGNQLATVLLKVEKKDEMKELLELIFDVWVDKILYAAIRCSKDSHAKQLGRGGELTTIVWIVAEHAGLFRIGDNDTDPPDGDNKDNPENRGNQEPSGSNETKGNQGSGGNYGGCPYEELDEKKKKICHQYPVGPHVCPNVSCVQDYCCNMDHYYYC